MVSDERRAAGQANARPSRGNVSPSPLARGKAPLKRAAKAKFLLAHPGSPGILQFKAIPCLAQGLKGFPLSKQAGASEFGHPLS